MIKRVLIILGIIIISVLALTGGFYLLKPKTAYVDINELYDNFSYKLELERSFDKEENRRKGLLDSLELNVKQLYQQLVSCNNSGEQEKLKIRFSNSREKYLQSKEKFDSEMSELKLRYKEMIGYQLNDYVQEYGKQHNYTYIYGAKGDGGLLYATPKNNITEDVLIYVNQRYEGN